MQSQTHEFFRYTDYLHHRMPNWRFQRAQYLRFEGRQPVSGLDDEWVLKAVAWLEWLVRDDGFEEDGPPEELEPIVRAFQIRAKRRPFQRVALDARLLAYADLQEVATKSKIDFEVVEAYERIFFSRESGQDASDFLDDLVRETKSSIVAAIYSIAVRGGPRALEPVLRAVKRHARQFVFWSLG